MQQLLGVLLLAPLLHIPAAAAAAQQSALAAYTQCPLSANLKATSILRGAVMPRERKVDTGAGQRTISVADGYKAMFAFPDTADFVNLKVERSVAGRYAADKQAVLDQMQQMVKRAPAGSGTGIERSNADGIDIAAINNTALVNGVISFYTLFDDKQEVIATAYLLNQDPKRRAFQSFEQYKTLRDGFVRDFTACMAAINSAPA